MYCCPVSMCGVCVITKSVIGLWVIVEEVIEVDELNEGSVSVTAGKQDDS